jgi:hypothetical protein
MGVMNCQTNYVPISSVLISTADVARPTWIWAGRPQFFPVTCYRGRSLRPMR